MTEMISKIYPTDHGNILNIIMQILVRINKKESTNVQGNIFEKNLGPNFYLEKLNKCKKSPIVGLIEENDQKFEILSLSSTVIL